MRLLGAVAVIALGCSSDEPQGPRLGPCDWGAATGSNCGCFDGEVRCDPLPRCPMSITGVVAPPPPPLCTPAAKCGDLAGGSNADDCHCTCNAFRQWICLTELGGSPCVPM
jgi:hypothetical protein